ncbi:hypothetical protein AAG906_021039 [Vitis piasezkii]
MEEGLDNVYRAMKREFNLSNFFTVDSTDPSSRATCSYSTMSPRQQSKSNFEDVFPEDEWLGFLFLGVKEASGGRLVKIETPHKTYHHGQQDNPNAFRSMRDCMHPPRMSAPSCIVPPTEQLVIRPHIVPLLPTFHGMESENPYAHIKEFEDVSEFLKKFFPTHRTNGLKRQISNFSAKENEKFYECWERYMEAINACPHHGFDTWLLVSYFYDGMSSSMKQLLETMCGGDFMSKNPEEAMDFLNYVAEVSRGWDEPNREKWEE